MPNLWKLSLKPEHHATHDPFRFCRENSLVGIGWHHVYANDLRGVPSSAEEAFRLIREEWRNAKNLDVPRNFLFELKAGDLVWIHQAGSYWLCKITPGLLFGPQISEHYQALDLGQARPAEWVEVKPSLIDGATLRACIVPKTLQRIGHLSERMKTAYARLHEVLKASPFELPRLEDDKIRTWLAKEHRSEIQDILTPDDVEDLVAYHLQSRGWYLRKSSCFRSRPVFEFELVHHCTSKLAYVQVKTGSYSLDAKNYRKWAQEADVFLHANSVVDEEAVPGVKSLGMNELLDWAAENPWAIGPAIRMRLALHAS